MINQNNIFTEFLNPGTLSKCYECPTYKSKDVEIVQKLKSSLLYKVGDQDELLIVLEMVESQERIQALKRLLNYCNIKDYTIIGGIQCRTKSFKLNNPYYATYNACDTDSEIDYNKYKAIVTIGRGLFSITKGDDIPSFEQYAEYLFNPTYFYTGFKTKNKVRVYPAPPLFECFKESPDDRNNYNKENFYFWFLKHQLVEAKKHIDNYTPFEFKPYNLIKVDDPNKFFIEHREAKTAAIDIETSGLFHFHPDFRIGCVTISFDGIIGYYLEWDKINKRTFNRFLSNKFQIYANGRFDVIGFRVNGVENSKVDYDVNTSYHVLSTIRKKVGLKTQGWDLGFGGYDNELDSYKKRFKIKNYLDIPEHVMFPYATLDPIVTFRSYERQLELFKEQPKVYDVYVETIIPVIEVFIEAEIGGAYADIDQVNKIRDDLKIKVLNLESKIRPHFKKKDINLNSGDELGKALESMGYPDLGRNEKGLYNVSSYELQMWKKNDESKKELMDLLLEYRKNIIVLNTFIGDPSEEIQDEDRVGYDTSWITDLLGDSLGNDEQDNGVKYLTKEKGLYQFIFNNMVHPEFNPALADSYRGKSRNPNFQNILKSDEELSKLYRSLYTCPEDYWIYDWDYSGFQLRIIQIYSQDPTMLDIFLNHGGDMHSVTAQSVFARDMTVDDFIQVKKKEPFKMMRNKSKNINFLYAFGGSSNLFKKEALDLYWTDQEIMDYINTENPENIYNNYTKEFDPYLTVATDIRNKFFQTYDRLEVWIEECHRKGASQMFMDSPFGGRRHLALMKNMGIDSNRKKIKNLQNISVNSYVQNFEAVMIYNAMIKVFKHLKRYKMKSRIFAMVHDSISLYAHKSEAYDLYFIIKDAMEDLHTYSVPILAEAEAGNLWGFGKSIDDDNVEQMLKYRYLDELLKVA